MTILSLLDYIPKPALIVAFIALIVTAYFLAKQFFHAKQSVPVPVTIPTPDDHPISVSPVVNYFHFSQMPKNILSVTVMVFGAFVLAVSLIYSIYTVNSPASQDIRSKASSTSNSPYTVKITDSFKVRPETAAKWEKLLANVPLNPTTVTATASGVDGKTTLLTSGQTASFPAVTFTWFGDKAVEPGTKITGYYVYFGPKNTEIPFPKDGYKKTVNPVLDGVFVTDNSYTASNLQKGQTYYLYIQSKTDSLTPYYNIGLEQVGYLQTLPAKKLFTYILNP